METTKSLFKNTFFLLFLLVSGIVAVVLLIIRAKKQKQERQTTIDTVKQALTIGAGENTSNDISSSLLSVKPDPKYDGTKDALKLQNAIGTFWDDDQTVYDVISGKTKAQLKSLEISLQRLGYKSLQDYISTIFSDQDSTVFGFNIGTCIGIDCGKYEKALNMINAAK